MKQQGSGTYAAFKWRRGPVPNRYKDGRPVLFYHEGIASVYWWDDQSESWILSENLEFNMGDGDDMIWAPIFLKPAEELENG